MSGGQVSISEHGNTAIDRIIHATEYGYVLGYAPKRSELDGKFRTIKVEVARKGATLSFRRGYFARPAESFDPRKSIADRYASRDDYTKRYAKAVHELVRERWILPEDCETMLRQGEEDWAQANGR